MDLSELQKCITVGNAAGFSENDQIRIGSHKGRECTSKIESIDGNVITLKGAGIPVPPFDALVRQIVQASLVRDFGGPQEDSIEVDDVRGFYIGMPVRIGNEEKSENAVIENIRYDKSKRTAVTGDATENDDTPIPGIIVLDVYLANEYKANIDTIRDSMSPNEEVRIYKLTDKKLWDDAAERDTIEKVFKKAVRADSYAKGEGYFVGEMGVDELNIQCTINFRRKKALLDEQPTRQHSEYWGNPTQFACIGCDEEACNRALALAESDGESFLHSLGLISGGNNDSDKGTSANK